MTSRKKTTIPGTPPEEINTSGETAAAAGADATEPVAQEPVVQKPEADEPQAQELSLEERLDQIEMENAQLQVALEAVQSQAKDYLDSYQRGQAEFINYKRRVERDLQSSVQNATGNAIRRYLDVADDLERALKNRPSGAEGEQWAQGVDLIYRKLMNAFEADGVRVIEAEGQEFDPNLHEAISQEDHPQVESGHVIGVVQAGYTLGERVLRPARVRVAR